MPTVTFVDNKETTPIHPSYYVATIASYVHHLVLHLHQHLQSTTWLYPFYKLALGISINLPASSPLMTLISLMSSTTVFLLNSYSTSLLSMPTLKASTAHSPHIIDNPEK